MNANQSVKPQSSITGNMMSYTWRDEKNGRCFFQIATRREMPLKEMIQRTVVKQDLQKMNATSNIWSRVQVSVMRMRKRS